MLYRCFSACFVCLLMAVSALAEETKQESSPSPDSPVEETSAAPETPAPETSGNKWEFEMAPYVFLSVLNSKLSLRGYESETTMDIGDLLKVFKFGFMNHAEARYGNWGMFNDFAYAKLGESTNVQLKRGLFRPGVGVDADMTQTIVELGGYYRLGGERLSYDILAGGRYVNFGADAEVGPFDIDKSADWVDPFVGGRLGLKLADRWAASLRTDVGGFGAGSKFSFNAIAGLRYEISEKTDLGFGFKYFYFDYEDNDFEMKSTAYGPIIGMVMKF